MDKTFTLGQLLSAGALGLLTGFMVSRTTTSHASTKKSSKDKTSKKQEKQAQDKDDNDGEDDEDYTSDEDDSENDDNDDLSEFDLQEEYKMVLVVRSDLGMGKGKAAAQCCHATLANYKELLKKSPEACAVALSIAIALKRWEYCGQAKVTLKVDSEDDMLLLQAQAQSLGLAAHCIRDAGRTQIAAGSRTVLAVGPGPISVVNGVTGHLKLY
ncbi:hypothetical protein BGZ99_010199 [Dissophora globulifera]|uniref:peptidyl-tRNA hydrolase n=1 Tax=Dissophora globulifera TaxID=979702 RepID=A0A9P6RSU4_9FUNG|nr:hypothetical protein BGZ99_010199 [Dissophora globulifera]